MTACLSNAELVCQSIQPDFVLRSAVLDRRVREERKRRDLSQQALAAAAGVPRSQLTILENGGNVTVATLEKIVAQLPGLRLDLVPDTLDVDTILHSAREMQNFALALYGVAGQIIAVLDPPPPPARRTANVPLDPSFDPALIERLEAEVDVLEQQSRERRAARAARKAAEPDEPAQ